MKIQEIELNKLKPATYNPRQINKRQFNDLKVSIEKFGLIDPIIINKDFTVIGGHQRLKICEILKFKKVPCVVLELDKDQEKELNIRLNKSGGAFDMDILANEFEIEDLNNWGFSDLELGLKSFDFEEEEFNEFENEGDVDKVKIELSMNIDTYKEIETELNKIITKFSDIKCKVIN